MKTKHITYRGLACPVEATLELIGGKWKGIILYHLLVDGTLRFNKLKKILHHVTQRMLTKQLRELEEAGLIHREVYPEVPPKVEYSLTETGRSLEPVLLLLKEWGEKHGKPIIIGLNGDQLDQEVCG